MKSSEKLTSELSILLASKVSVIIIQAREPDRAIECVVGLADDNKTKALLWKMTNGLNQLNSNGLFEPLNNDNAGKVGTDIIKFLSDSNKIISDHKYLVLQWANFAIDQSQPLIQTLSDLSRELPFDIRNKRIMILVDQSWTPPSGLDQIPIVKLNLPTASELSQVAISMLTDSIGLNQRPNFTVVDYQTIGDNLTGLTKVESENAVATVITRNRTTISNITANKFAEQVSEFKTSIINKADSLTHWPHVPIKNVGGLEVLKEDAYMIEKCLTPKAKALNIDPPKGMLLVGASGCVDRDTEFLTPTGWKYIGDYQNGDLICQWSKSGETEFVSPQEYIKLPAEKMYQVKTKTVDMVLSLGHRFPYITSKNNFSVKSFEDILKMERVKIPRYFKASDTEGVDLTDEEIRVLVMQSADGHFRKTKRYDKVSISINVKKKRKIERVEKLLTDADIDFNIHLSGAGYKRFFYFAPKQLEEKSLSQLWECDKHQMSVVFDEVFNWDGCKDIRNGKERLRFTGNKSDCDLVQYISSSVTGNYCSISKDKRIYKNGDLYNLHVSRRTTSHLKFESNNKNANVSEYTTLDGFQYCFKTPSSFWLARRNGKIFPTGNTGKTLVAQAVSSILHMPLIQWDVSMVFGGLVGSSTKNISSALDILEATSPCVVLLDEIEKVFNSGRGTNDGGIKDEVLGILLSFMSREREKPIFFVLTANEPWLLPAPLLRKGRVDTVYNIGMPNRTEREAIYRIHLGKRKVTVPKDLEVAITGSKGYSGAEIEESVIQAMKSKFITDGNVKISGALMMEQIKKTKSNSEMFKDQTKEMIKWATDNAKNASIPDETMKPVSPMNTLSRRRSLS